MNRLRTRRALRTGLLLTVAATFHVLPSLGSSAASFARSGNSVTTGRARFQVLTPTLMRTELAPEPATLHGVISRSGWFLLNDSTTPVYDPITDWIRPRAKPGSKDLYLFVYGQDYKRALREYANLLGAVPMVPRWSLGAWFSRFWDYPDWELKEVVGEFRRRQVPLDVLVLDMGWHDHGFEGYDWNKEHYPDPAGSLKWRREQGLRVALNNHPRILPIEESKFAEVRKLLGFPGSGYEPVEFNLADQKHVKVFMEVLHNPLIDVGVDFWWVDGWAARMEGLNNQFWTSHV